MRACVYAIKDPGLFFGGHCLVTTNSSSRGLPEAVSRCLVLPGHFFRSRWFSVKIYIEILTNWEMYAKMKILCINISIHRCF